MKILLVNKFHYLKGGSEKYYFELAELLKQNGHEVAFFSMEDEKNIKTGCREYFVKPIDLNKGSKLKALDVIYSKENKKKIQIQKTCKLGFSPGAYHRFSDFLRLSDTLKRRREAERYYNLHCFRLIYNCGVGIFYCLCRNTQEKEF